MQFVNAGKWSHASQGDRAVYIQNSFGLFIFTIDKLKSVLDHSIVGGTSPKIFQTKVGRKNVRALIEASST